MLIDGVRINYGVLDQSIKYDSIDNTTSSNSPYSNAQNTVTNKGNQKIAYLEKDYFALDGTFICPEDEVAYNVGWESSELSDESGNVFSFIEYTFSNLHDSYGIELLFPDNCISKNFSIYYYNGDVLIGSADIVDNTKSRYTNYDIRLQWNKIRVVFTKTNPYQRARLWGITFGINELYDEDVLISVSAGKTIELSGGYDDCGEFAFTFYNKGRFNIKDTNDMPLWLQEGLSVSIYVKAKGSDEYVPFGNYYSERTDVLENGDVISVFGYDELYRLNDTIFKKGIVYENGRSLKEWAEEVADDAGIRLSVDSSFGDIISYGYITEVPHREALRLIAEAGNGMLILDSNGSMSLKKHVAVDNGELTDDDIVNGTKTSENPEKILGVSVSKYTFSPASKDQELGYLEEIGLTSELQEIEITYSTFPAIVSSIQVFVDTSSSAVVSNLRIYSDRCVFDISGTDGDSTFVTVTGRAYNSAITQVTRGSTIKNIKKIESNYLITGDIANDVADYQHERVVNKYNHSAEIVCDRKLDLGDRVLIDGSETIITKTSFTISYEENVETIGAVDE